MRHVHPRGLDLKSRLPAFLLGFLAAAFQIYLHREFSAEFYGNELTFGLFLGSWLLWGGLGSLARPEATRESSSGRLYGLYGLAIGGLFAAESMFHRVRDASKVAVAALVEHARRVGTTLVDVQVPSEHLASLGVIAIAREDYLRRLAAALTRRVAFASCTVSP